MVVSTIDPTDGSQADVTIRFGLDGAEFELNLSMAHAEELRRTLGPYIKVARKIGSERNGGRHGSAATNQNQIRSIRDLVSNTPVSGVARNASIP